MARILLVDDDRAIRTTIELLLKRAGHQTVATAEGREGLKKIEAERFIPAAGRLQRSARLSVGPSGADCAICEAHGPSSGHIARGECELIFLALPLSPPPCYGDLVHNRGMAHRLRARNEKMFEYFEDNYTWNMAVNLALGMGGSIGDIDDASRALRPLAKQRDDAAAEKFFENWTALGAKLKRQAAADEARGRRLSAGAKYRRAFIALIQAERMQRPDFAPRQEAYRDALDCFSRFLTLTRQNCRRVDAPYLNTSLPALLVVPQNAAADTPCMVHFDGLDVTKEIIYLVGVPGALAERGIATLVVDNPGVGESLRMRGLHNGPEAEIPAKAAVDFLQSTPGIDRNRIGIMALSLGGYHAPRIAAFEPRMKCAVAWGANYDWGETQRRRYESKDQRLPVPHYWDHVGWVFGKSSVEEVVAVSEKLSLKGILHQIKCPILCIHGENDRQIPLSQAQRLIAECTSSPKAELHVQTLADGGAEHCGVDNVAPTREFICDWIAEVLGGNPAGKN